LGDCGRELVGLGRRLERFVIERQKKTHRHARRLTIDLDSTEDPTHGFWCYPPMLGFPTS